MAINQAMAASDSVPADEKFAGPGFHSNAARGQRGQVATQWLI
jgi:hypothetical protein